ncbi:MAG: hypothetical protein ACI8VT_002033, partial [Saprospiraceae bacterium]
KGDCADCQNKNPKRSGCFVKFQALSINFGHH